MSEEAAPLVRTDEMIRSIGSCPACGDLMRAVCTVESSMQVPAWHAGSGERPTPRANSRIVAAAVAHACDSRTPAVAETLNPDLWCQILGIDMKDPDGWRGADAQTWLTPVTREEFERRAAVSTVDTMKPRTQHNPWDVECSRRISGESTHPFGVCYPCRNLDPRQEVDRG